MFHQVLDLRGRLIYPFQCNLSISDRNLSAKLYLAVEGGKDSYSTKWGKHFIFLLYLPMPSVMDNNMLRILSQGNSGPVLITVNTHTSCLYVSTSVCMKEPTCIHFVMKTRKRCLDKYRIRPIVWIVQMLNVT